MSTTLLTLEHDPGTLTNNIGTALNVVLDDGSMLARGLLRLSKGVRPAGVPGFVHTAYKYILLLILAVARLDGSALTGRLQPLRGTFEEGWMQAVCRGLEDLGAFISPAK